MVRFQTGSARRNIGFNPSTPQNPQKPVPADPEAPVIDSVITGLNQSQWSIIPMKAPNGKNIFAVRYSDPMGGQHIVHIFEAPESGDTDILPTS